MWSVNTVPKARSLSFGRSFLFVLFVTRIASLLIYAPLGDDDNDGPSLGTAHLDHSRRPVKR